MNTVSIQSTVTMEQAIRSAITAAVHQVKSKMYEREPEDPVQAFLDDLFAVLFPTPVQAVETMPPLLQRTDTVNHTNCDAACCKPQEVSVPAVEETPAAPKEKKPRKKKADSPASTAAVEETPAAPVKEKKPRKKKADSPAAPAPVVEETPAAPAKEKKPRKKKADSPAAPAPVTEVSAPAPAAVTPPPAPAATEAPAAPKKEKKPKSPKPEGVNLDKLTPTQVKKLKAVADELKVELDKKAFLAHLNAMSGPVFGATTLESHYRTFVQPDATPVVVQEQEKDLDAVEVAFNGKTYYVDESDMRVYEQQGEVFAPVGYVGMAAFKDLELPKEEVA
jgi:hypothetical protein